MIVATNCNLSVVHVLDATNTSRVLNYRFRCRTFYNTDSVAAFIVRLSNSVDREQKQRCILNARTTNSRRPSTTCPSTNLQILTSPASKPLVWLQLRRRPIHQHPATSHKPQARQLAGKRRFQSRHPRSLRAFERSRFFSSSGCVQPQLLWRRVYLDLRRFRYLNSALFLWQRRPSSPALRKC